MVLIIFWLIKNILSDKELLRHTDRTAGASSAGSTSLRRYPATPAAIATGMAEESSRSIRTRNRTEGTADGIAVGQHDVGHERAGCVDDLGVTACLAHDPEVGLRLERGPQPAPEQRLLVDQQHADQIPATRRTTLRRLCHTNTPTSSTYVAT
jgi:hypothetical protein